MAIKFPGHGNAAWCCCLAAWRSNCKDHWCQQRSVMKNKKLSLVLQGCMSIGIQRIFVNPCAANQSLHCLISSSIPVSMHLWKQIHLQSDLKQSASKMHDWPVTLIYHAGVFAGSGSKWLVAPPTWESILEDKTKFQEYDRRFCMALVQKELWIDGVHTQSTLHVATLAGTMRIM